MITTGEIKLVTALSWPVAVLVLALFFQGSIKDLLKRLKTVEGPGFKGAFSEQAEKALSTADHIEVEVPVRDPATLALIHQTASHPWWAVHQAWRLVREAARDATGGRYGDGIGTPDRVRALRDEGRVPEEVYQLTRTLHGLYLDIRSSPGQLTPDAASDYVEAAAKLGQALLAAKRSPARPDTARPTGADR
jgi:hypothetical protein